MDPRDERESWFQEILERHQGHLLRLATGIVRDPERAADVVQDTFRCLLQARREDIQDHVEAWLRRVCRHRAIDSRRKERSGMAVAILDVDGLEASAHAPSTALELAELGVTVRQVLGGLSRQHLDVVRLRFQGGLSYQEIAEAKGLTKSHVGVLLHEALKCVRGRLDRVEDSRRRMP